MKWTDYSNLTGWVDYDRNSLHQLTYIQKIYYFDKRLNMVLFKPMNEILRSISKSQSANQSFLLIFATSACCSIEALGKFMKGRFGNPPPRDGNWQRFQTFLKRMDPDYRHQRLGNETYGKILWKYFRNGLAHGFTICHGGFEFQSQYFTVRNNTLLIDPKHFFQDFSNAYKRYLKDLRDKNNLSLCNNFEYIFKEVFINGR